MLMRDRNSPYTFTPRQMGRYDTESNLRDSTVANVWVSPGQRADTKSRSSTTNAGRESLAVSRTIPDDLSHQFGDPRAASRKSAGSLSARVTSDCTDMYPL